MTASLCRDSTAGTGTDLAYLNALATSTDPQYTLLRSRASLPSASSSDVSFVTDTTLCRRAAEGIRHVIYNADTGALQPLDLFRYGSTRYVGSWPTKIGEFSGLVVFDTSFAMVGGIAQ
jgi:hypothetical protein